MLGTISLQESWPFATTKFVAKNKKPLRKTFSAMTSVVAGHGVAKKYRNDKLLLRFTLILQRHRKYFVVAKDATKE
ncbi:MAG: hypothetical protein Q8877_03115 [Sweet potato little leaf phytoplasma]|nr:hypothetical protein [Sweet potato little leaf phytoplasma]